MTAHCYCKTSRNCCAIRLPCIAVQIMVKKLHEHGLHTYIGMLGYCTKDQRLPHYKVIMHNVTEDELNQGRDEYLKYGAGNLKTRTALTPSSMFTKALVFYSLHAREDRNSCTFQSLLLEMLKTGKYFPTASWVIPFQGRGMSHHRAAALWKMYISPATVTPEDVHL